MASSVVYVVSDFGGEWEDSWEFPIIAFTDEGRARECAAKREARRLAQRLDDEWDEYTGSMVRGVPLVMD